MFIFVSACTWHRFDTYAHSSLQKFCRPIFFVHFDRDFFAVFFKLLSITNAECNQYLLFDASMPNLVQQQFVRFGGLVKSRDNRHFTDRTAIKNICFCLCYKRIAFFFLPFSSDPLRVRHALNCTSLIRGWNSRRDRFVWVLSNATWNSYDVKLKRNCFRLSLLRRGYSSWRKCWKIYPTSFWVHGMWKISNVSLSALIYSGKSSTKWV